MITNKAYKRNILEKIEVLKYSQDCCRRQIEAEVHEAKKLGYIVRKYEDLTFVYRPDWTIPDLIQSSIRHSEGVIDGLQAAIYMLEMEL